MALAEEIMALAPGSPELEGIRSRAYKGEPAALERYVWWSVWKMVHEDKRFGRREAMEKFRILVESMKLQVALDG